MSTLYALAPDDHRMLSSLLDQTRLKFQEQGKGRKGYDAKAPAAPVFIVKGSIAAGSAIGSGSGTGTGTGSGSGGSDVEYTPGEATLPCWKVKFTDEGHILERIEGATRRCFNIYSCELGDGFHVATRDVYGRLYAHYDTIGDGAGSGSGSGTGTGTGSGSGSAASPCDIVGVCSRGQAGAGDVCCPAGSSSLFLGAEVEVEDGTGSGSGTGALATCPYICLDDDKIGTVVCGSGSGSGSG